MSAAGPNQTPPPSFQALLLMLGTQAMIDLGEIPNPMTGEPAVDLRKARWHLELLRMLEAKTEGNLDDAELNAVNNIIRDVDEKWREKSAAAEA
jgi:uncharacterized protein DUF1844